jgi:ABC-type phosphate/phosphonate transport system substrate-binding protein
MTMALFMHIRDRCASDHPIFTRAGRRALSLRRTCLGLFLVLSLGTATTWAADPARSLAPIKYCFYATMFSGVSEANAKASTAPLLATLSRKIDYPCAPIDVVHSTGPKDLFALGEKLNDGSYHAACMWGLECGLLQQKYPMLEPLGVISVGGQLSWRSQLMVRRQNPSPTLAQLKGKKLATFLDAPVMDEFLLEQMLSAETLNPQGFFQRSKPLANLKEAISRVRHGEADCVLVSSAAFNHLSEGQPALKEALVPIAESAPYPGPVVLAAPAHLEKLQPGLMRKVQDELVAIHKTPGGALSFRFWRVDRYVKPDAEYLGQVKKSAQAFPRRLLVSEK